MFEPVGRDKINKFKQSKASILTYQKSSRKIQSLNVEIRKQTRGGHIPKARNSIYQPTLGHSLHHQHPALKRENLTKVPAQVNELG